MIDEVEQSECLNYITSVVMNPPTGMSIRDMLRDPGGNKDFYTTWFSWQAPSYLLEIVCVDDKCDSIWLIADDLDHVQKKFRLVGEECAVNEQTQARITQLFNEAKGLMEDAE